MTLDAPGQQVIEVFADPSRPEHAALVAWASQRGLNVMDASDATIVRMLVRAGAEALRERALDAGYAKLAATRDESQRERRALRDGVVGRAQTRFAE